MKKIEKIDFNKVIVGNLSNMFSEERFIELKELAKKERAGIDKSRRYGKYTSMHTMPQDRAYSKKNYTDQEKNFIYANIIFQDNEKFLKLLNKSIIPSGLCECDYKSLSSLINMLKYLKLKSKAKKEYDAHDLKIYKYCLLSVSIFTTTISINIGDTNPEPIITKIAEIISTDKELFDKIDKEEEKTITKELKLF